MNWPKYTIPSKMQTNNDPQKVKNPVPAQGESQSTVTLSPNSSTSANQTAAPQQSNPQDISEEKKQQDLERLLQQKQNKFLSNEAREKATTLPMSNISNPFRDTDK